MYYEVNENFFFITWNQIYLSSHFQLLFYSGPWQTKELRANLSNRLASWSKWELFPHCCSICVHECNRCLMSYFFWNRRRFSINWLKQSLVVKYELRWIWVQEVRKKILIYFTATSQFEGRLLKNSKSSRIEVNEIFFSLLDSNGE